MVKLASPMLPGSERKTHPPWREIADGIESVEVSLTLRRHQTFGEFIGQANFDKIHQHFTPRNFPIPSRRIDSRIRVKILYFALVKRKMSVLDVQNFVQSNGKVADLETLVAIAADFPDIQFERKIAALGSPWMFEKQVLQIPIICGRNGSRVLDLAFGNSIWLQNVAFALLL